MRSRRSRTVATVLVVLATALWSIPTLGLFVTALRTNEAQAYAGWWQVVVDHQVSLDSYQQVLTGGDLLPTGIWPYLLNSIVIVLPVMAVGLTVAAMCAYALAWLRVPSSAVLIGILVGLQAVPIQMTLLPLLKLFSVGWSIGPIPVIPLITNAAGKPLFAGTFVPLWFTHTVLLLPLSVLLLHRAMVGVPRGLIDAARVDGAGHPLILRRIVMPLCLPTLAALGIFEFLWVWNDLLIASTFVPGGSDFAPVTAYLSYLNGALQQDNLLSAGTFVAILIPLAVFFAMQRHFARGLTAGALNE